MLYQAKITYAFHGQKNLDSDLSVKIHGAAMRLISPELADRLHRPQYHALSLYCTEQEEEVVLHISALDAESANVITALMQQPQLRIYGASVPLVQKHTKMECAASLSDLAERLDSPAAELHFVTPAMYKTAGRYVAPPSPEKYFYSVIQKLNSFLGTSYTYDAFLKQWTDCRVKAYALRTASYPITGYFYTGMTGTLTLALPNEAQLLREVLSGAAYSGIGSKTTQGMGGFQVSAV